MSIKIDGTDIESSYVEYGVQWEDGDVSSGFDMDEAYQMVNLGTGAKVLARRVYETAWAEVSK